MTEVEGIGSKGLALGLRSRLCNEVGLVGLGQPQVRGSGSSENLDDCSRGDWLQGIGSRTLFKAM